MGNLTGAEHDEAVDALIESRDAEETLRDMYVDLDRIADSRDLSGQLRYEIRQAQKNVERALHTAESETNDNLERFK